MENKKSFVSRSVYQKLFEENKRLKKDIEILIVAPNGMDEEWASVWDKWHSHFEKEKQFNSVMKKVATEYLKDHPEYDINSPKFKRFKEETKTK